VEKEEILAEAFAPGASVAEVSRRRGVNANLVFVWRRLQENGLLDAHSRGRRRPKLLPVQVITAPADGTKPVVTSALRVDFPGGMHLHVGSGADPAVLERVIALLRR
jgi:transposase